MCGCLTVSGGTTNGQHIPRGKPWDRQPVSGKLRRKLGVSPGFAAHFCPAPPKRFGTPWRRLAPGATPFSEGAALAVAPAGEIVFGGSLLHFVVARGDPLGEAAFLQALQEAAAAARSQPALLLFGQFLGGLEALAGDRRLARPDEQREVAQRREIAGGDGMP